jgi:hypothetical protein
MFDRRASRGLAVAVRLAAESGASVEVPSGKLDSVLSVTEQRQQQASDDEGERVRRLRLQTDGRRPPAVNLKETILLSRKLFELRDRARHGR